MKKEPWRIIIGILSAAWIIYMWVKKDIAAIYTAMPPEQILPAVVTTIAVTLLKVISIATVILLAKRLAGKLKK